MKRLEGQFITSFNDAEFREWSDESTDSEVTQAAVERASGSSRAFVFSQQQKINKRS